MKKILISLLVFLGVVLTLPIIGNSIMQNSIDTRLEELRAYGLESKNIQKESAYLTTKQHFEFVLEDVDAFVAYLSRYADQQIPPYVNAMFKGVLIGADLEYSNFPLSNSIELDIYPLSLSESMSENLKKDNLDFYEYLETLLQSKGVLYHISYNIASEDFNGYIKDINEKYLLKDKSEITFLLQDATFEGNGELIAPNRVAMRLQKIDIGFVEDGEKLLFNILDFQSASSYESKSTYINSAELKDINIEISGGISDVMFKLHDLQFNGSSNTQGEFAELDSKSSLKTLLINSKELNMDLKNFHLDTSVDSLDKVSFQESMEYLSKMKNMNDPLLAQQFKTSLTALLSKGFVFTIADFSVEDIVLNKTEMLKGFEMQSKIILKEDQDIAKKMQMSPLLVASNLDVDTKLRVSNEIYNKATATRPLPTKFQSYLKQDADGYTFALTYKDGIAKLNGKVLQ